MRSSAWLAMAVAVLGLPVAAMAAPVWGANCMSCHGVEYNGTIDVFGNDSVTDPDESATGASDRGFLKTFSVRAGESKELLVDVFGLESADKYAVELKRMRFPGVENGGTLNYSADCEWPFWRDPGQHFTMPEVSYRWQEDGEGHPTSPTTFSFEINVQEDSTYDVYNLTFALAGVSAVDNDLFHEQEHFYVEVLPRRGDLDADSDVDLADFGIFQGCLNGPGNSTPPATCTTEQFNNADFDEDGDVDLHDFAGLMSYLD